MVFDVVQVEKAGGWYAGFGKDLVARAVLGVVGEEPGGAEGDDTRGGGDFGGGVFGEGERDFGGGDEVGFEERDGAGLGHVGQSGEGVVGGFEDWTDAEGCEGLEIAVDWVCHCVLDSRLIMSGWVIGEDGGLVVGHCTIDLNGIVQINTKKRNRREFFLKYVRERR